MSSHNVTCSRPDIHALFTNESSSLVRGLRSPVGRSATVRQHSDWTCIHLHTCIKTRYMHVYTHSDAFIIHVDVLAWNKRVRVGVSWFFLKIAFRALNQRIEWFDTLKSSFCTVLAITNVP